MNSLDVRRKRCVSPPGAGFPLGFDPEVRVSAQVPSATSWMAGVLGAAMLLATMLLATMLLATACVGPERAPHQPITGVDRPAESRDAERDGDRSPAGASGQPGETRPGPGDGAGASAARGVLAERIATFAADVARAHRTRPGPVAVFWPLSKSPTARGSKHVNGLGERIAREVADALRAEGVSTLAGDTLIHAIQEGNRSLPFYRQVDDAYDLAERAGATYVAFGTVERIVRSRMQRDERLELALSCRDVFERQSAAALRCSWTTGGEARELARDFAMPASVVVGADAPITAPATDREAAILMAMLARRVIVQHGVDLEGKRVVIEPTSIRSVSGDRAELQALMLAFDRAYRSAVESARSAAVARPIHTALEQPFSYAEERFDHLSEALDVIERQRLTLGATPAEQLATDLSRALTESLMAAGGKFDVLGGQTGRDAILAVVRREAAAASEEGAVDAETISGLRQRGAQVLVRSTLRPYLGSYQLRVMLLDMATNRLVSDSIAFERRFKSDLDAYTK